MPPRRLTTITFTEGNTADKPDRVHHPLALGTTTDIQEICCFAAIELDEIERGHREPGTIPDHADRTVQFDIRKTILLCLTFAVSEIAVDRKSLPSEGIVVNDQFCIGCKYPFRRGDQRVDLREQCIFFQEYTVKFVDDRADLFWCCSHQFPEHERRYIPHQRVC